MKTRKAIKIIYLLLLLFSAAVTNRAQCVPASTAAGAYDTCFDGDGKVTTDITAGYEYAGAVVVQPDGKIVAAGVTGTPSTSDSDFVLVRYNTDGSLDTSFSGDGIVITNFALNDGLSSIALQSDGKIVVAGQAYATQQGDYQIVVLRYNANGSLDNSFDLDGIAQYTRPNVGMYAEGVIVQPDGKILVAARFLAFDMGFSLVLRYDPNGSLDTSFDSDGAVVGTMNSAYDFALLPDGKILISGSVNTGTLALARLNSNGSPDVFFGNNGVVTFHSTNSLTPCAMAVRSDGSIFVAATFEVFEPQYYNIRFLRFNSDGTFAAHSIRNTDYYYTQMIMRPDGKALTAGISFDPNWGATIRRFTDVSLDAIFTGGTVRVKFLPEATPQSASIGGIAMTRDNKIIAAGGATEETTPSTPSRFAVARFFSGLQAPHPERFDFDGDGKADLSVFRPSNGEWWYLRSYDGLNASAQFGAGTDIITPGDYTGDGRTDIAVWRPSTGEWFVLRTEDFSYYSFPFGTAGDVPRPSDFDGAGKTDYIVYRPSENFWYRINSNGITSFRQFGIAGDKPVVGDFDGDGKSDLAVYRPSSGDWLYQSSINNAQLAVRWGIATDVPVPADFDADGKTDVAVYRPSTGTWYIINSSNGSFTVTNFGLSEDKPVPADYDGDGKTDVAVFRPSTGVWYQMRSTAGFAAQQFGLSSDIPTPNAYIF